MGTPTHDGDLSMIMPALERIAREIPFFEVSLIGVTSDAGIFEGREGWLKQISVPQDKKSYEDFVPWLREQAEYVDFAIAPLSDEPFNLCKSPLKLIDYAALGLPTVASDHPVYRTIAKGAPGVTLAKNTLEDWSAAIMAAINVGARSPEATNLQRVWVLSSFMLEDEGESIDKLIGTLSLK